MKTTMRLFLLFCAVFMASQPVLAQNDEDTRNKAVITTDDGDRQLITDEISVIRFDGPKVTVVQPWGDTVFDRTLRNLTFLRPLPGTLRLTVNVSKDDQVSTTRGHELNGDGYLLSTWSADDRVYVYDNATTDTPIGTLTPETTGGQVSKMTGNITAAGIAPGQTLYLSTQPRTYSYATQTGDLEASGIFYLTTTAEVTSIKGGNATTADATFALAQAIVRFTLTDGSNAVNVTQLVISGGAGNITITPTPATNVLYVAMPAAASTAYSLTATDNSGREWTGSKTATLGYGYYRTTVTMTKTKLTPSVTAPTALSPTYTGSAQALVNEGLTTGGTLYYIATSTNSAPDIDDAGWATTVPTGTNAGTYYVWTKVSGNADYNDAGVSATSVEVTIGQKALTITAKDQTIDYGASIATGTAQVTPTGLVDGDALTTIDLTPSGSDVTTTGSITPSAAETTNGIGNYSVTYTAGNLTITAVSASVTTAPAAVTGDLTYNGSAQALVTGGTATGGTMKYFVNTTGTVPTTETAGWEDSAPTGTAAGTYYVWYYVAGDGNHTSTAVTAIEGDSKAIGKKALTVTAEAKSKDYGADNPALTYTHGELATGDNETVFTGALLCEATTTSEPGEYDITQGTLSAGDNYEISYTGAKLTVNSLDMSSGVTVTPYNAAYDGNAHGITIVLSGAAEGATITYCDTENGTYQAENYTYTDVAATRTVWYKIEKEHYTTITGSSTVTITQATNSFTTQPTITGWTYGSAANAPTGGVVEFGEIVYKYCATAAGTYDTYANVVNGQAGTWYVKGFVEATTNYAAAESNAVEFTITGAGSINYGTTAVEKTLAAPAFTNELTKVGDGSVTYALSDGEVICAVDAITGEVTLNGTAGTCTITATVTNSALYTYATPTASYTLTVLPVLDLSLVTANTTVPSGVTITGALGGDYKISIAEGATVTLSGVNINGSGTWTSGSYAGLNCLGDATVVLSDGTTNTVKGFYSYYPGIHVPSGSTLTIQGKGTLNASSNGNGAGIGAGKNIPCGNITINGGTITATGGSNAAGIGGGNATSCGTISITGGTVEATGGSNAAGIGGSNNALCGNIRITGGTVTATGGSSGAGIGSGCRQSGSSSCGTITISGGTVTATGGSYAAGIGSGANASCGDITIENTVTRVTATKGSSATNSIGKGYGGTCGTVTIGGTVYWNGSSYQNDGNTYLPTSPLVYPLTIDLSTVTANTTVADGYTITGTLSGNHKISIADGATVTLKNVTINRTSSSNPGITCMGTATINLVGTNTVNGGTGKAGIEIGGAETTLTINGPGSLQARGGQRSAGIGLSRAWGVGAVTGGNIVINGGIITAQGDSDWGAGIGTGASWGTGTSVTIGNITINGGDVTATGGSNGGAAGIGTSFTYGGSSTNMGNITIIGGIVNATGYGDAAGIGTGHAHDGYVNRIGSITINSTVTRVTATKGSSATHSIGQGTSNTVIGTVTIGGNTGAISDSPYTYQP